MDSRYETVQHILRVRKLLDIFIKHLLERGLIHDQSKLSKKEKPFFDHMTPFLKNRIYGSKKYFQDLTKELKPALNHHYNVNRHHPEFHKKGIGGMTLIDLIELFVDWKAASERHMTGSLKRSIKINAKRFKMSGQLAQIFENTRKNLKL